MLEISQNVFRDIVDRLIVACEVLEHACTGQVAWSRSRCVKKGAAGSARTIYDRFRKLDHTFGVVSAGSAVVIDEPRPPAPNADNALAFAPRTYGDCPDRRIQPRNISASSKNRDRPLAACHAIKASGAGQHQLISRGHRSEHPRTRAPYVDTEDVRSH